MSDEQIVDRFGQLLHSSVERACRGAARVGISLSAGLDSSSIAAIAGRRRPDTLTVTQGLPGYPEIDESTLAAELARSLGMHHHNFPADQLLPFADAELHPICPDHPVQSPFRPWKEVSYRAMAAAGVDVCLDGGFADDLFAGDVEWVVNAIRFRRWGVLREQLAYLLSREGLSAMIQNTAVRRPLSRLFGRVKLHSDRLDWLRPNYRRLIEHRMDAEIRQFRDFPRPQQCMRLLGSTAAFDASAEQWYATRHGLEHRQPFRDHQLTRWCLSLPADLFTRQGQRKWLLREAMRGILPETLRKRRKSSDLTPVFDAVIENRKDALEHWFDAVSASRRRFLDQTAMGRLSGDNLAISRWLASSLGCWSQFIENRSDP
ncbi:MAG: asparagine synthase-related protein [Lysobacterales bacterium]